MRASRLAAAMTVAALAAAALCLALPIGAPAHSRLPVIYGAGTRPTHFYPDNRTTASGFHWSRWTAREAVGTGRTKTCAPGGQACISARQTITYSRPERVCGVLTYTRLRYSKWSVVVRLRSVSGKLCSWFE